MGDVVHSCPIRKQDDISCKELLEERWGSSMLIYIGDNPDTMKEVSRQYETGMVICQDGAFLGILEKGDDRRLIFLDTEYHILLVQGIGFNKPDTIIRQYEKHGEGFPGLLDGIFNIILWDKRRKRAVVANDKLGLNPIFYTSTSQNHLVISTKIKTIVKLGYFRKKTDDIAISQFARFNYILGRRTFMSGIFQLLPGSTLVWDNNRITERNYFNFGTMLKENSAEKDGTISNILTTLCNVISDYIKGKNRIGILLSGGYDSRAIIAVLSCLGVKGHAYTWDNPAIKETEVAEKIAGRSGFSHEYLPYYPEDELAPGIINEVEEKTDFMFPLFHIGRYYAVKKIAREVDILFSGQGELIRVTPIPNDYINSLTASLLLNKTEKVKEVHFFIVNGHDERQVFEDFTYRSHSPFERLTLFLLQNAYRSDYGILRYAESFHTPVAMPFLDARLVELLLKSPFSIARLHSWGRNIFTTFKNRQIYHAIIEKTAPGLLDVQMDRRYAPKYDRGVIGAAMTCIWGIRDSLSSRTRKRDVSSWEKYVHRLLSEERTLSRPFFDKEKIVNSLKKTCGWFPIEGYELEKVARFELWYRYFMEG